MFHEKEKGKTPEEQLIEVKRGNLLIKEIRIMIVKELQHIERRMSV